MTGRSGQIGAFRDMEAGDQAGRRERRLKSWKEIAAFFGADERTVKRWEAQRGLPVRRVPGARATVYADIAELEQWLRGTRLAPVAAAAGPPARPSRDIRLPLAVAGAILLAALALVGFDGLAPERAHSAGHRPSPEAVDIHLAGIYQWQRRTPESLNRAVQLFSQAIARDPDYAEPYAGLANCYLLLREYTGLPDEQAYPMAKDAAERALALDAGLMDAHAALGFVTFYWLRDFEGGLRRFERAIALDPASAHARHWYATALYHADRMPEALEQIGLAQRRDPYSRSILADKSLILYHSGREEEAVSNLRQLAAGEPEFLSPHAYLALIYLAEGRNEAYLGEARIAARLIGSKEQLRVLDAAERGLKRGGRRGMLAAMLAEQSGIRAEGGGSDYMLAGTHAMLGNRAEALRHLDASLGARETQILPVRVDPVFRSLHGDPAFRRLAKRVGRGIE